MSVQNSRRLSIVILMLLLLVIAVISGYGSAYASAAYGTHTDVLEDLNRDENFHESDYINNPLDHSIEIIQIAESSTGRLFIYTYQPCQKSRYLVATSINMSLSESVDGTKLYALTLINVNGVFGKYAVQELKVKSGEETRYYNISSVFRAWDKEIDAPADNDNEKNEVAYPVGHVWTAKTVNGVIEYGGKEIEVVEVSAQTVGARRYTDGINPLILHGDATDAHFLAFSTKNKIDKLLSADLEFYSQPYEISKGVTTFGRKTPHAVTLHDDEYAENPAGGWLGKKARWDRIASTNEFLNCGLQFSDKERELFNKYQWVLNFYETTFDAQANISFFPIVPLLSTLFTGDTSHMVSVSGTRVSEVALLRLEFEFAGEIYNLGVVADKQTGAFDPINTDKDWRELPWYTWLIVVGVIIIVLVILSIIFPNFGAFMLWLLKKLWLIISFPFRMLGKAIKAISERRAAAKAKPKAKPAKRKTAKKPTAKRKATKKGGKK